MSNKPAAELRAGDVIEVHGKPRSVVRVIGGEGHNTLIRVALPDGTELDLIREPDEEIEVFPADSTFPQGDALEEMTYPVEAWPELDSTSGGSMTMQTWRIPGGEMYFSIVTSGELTPGAHGAIAATMQALANLVDLLEIRETDG